MLFNLLTSLMLLLASLGAPSTQTASAPIAPADEARHLLLGELPHGWCVSQFQSATMFNPRQSLTVRAVDGSVNVIASREPIDASLTSRAYAEHQEVLMQRELADFDSTVLRATRVFGRAGVAREFTWRPSAEEPVHQIQGYVAAAGSGYVVTVTSTPEHFDASAAELRALLDLVTLSAPGADAMPDPGLELRCTEPSDDDPITFA